VLFINIKFSKLLYF